MEWLPIKIVQLSSSGIVAEDIGKVAVVAQEADDCGVRDVCRHELVQVRRVGRERSEVNWYDGRHDDCDDRKDDDFPHRRYMRIHAVHIFFSLTDDLHLIWLEVFGAWHNVIYPSQHAGSSGRLPGNLNKTGRKYIEVWSAYADGDGPTP
jgi:hypothetical protein